LSNRSKSFQDKLKHDNVRAKFCLHVQTDTDYGTAREQNDKDGEKSTQIKPGRVIVMVGWSELHNEKFHNLESSLIIISIIKLGG
jgi:hypothetical protein